MRPNRRLELRREALAPLESGELSAMAGGTHVYSDCGCLTHGFTCEVCPTPTMPIAACCLCHSEQFLLTCTCPIR